MMKFTEFISSTTSVSDEVKRKFDAVFFKLGYDGVKVTDAAQDIEGDWTLTITDYEGDSAIVTLFLDDDQTPMVHIAGEEDDDSAEFVDLSAYPVPISDFMFTRTINLNDLSWMNKSAVDSILGAIPLIDRKVEANLTTGLRTTGRVKRVVRGGKVEKRPVKIRTKRVRLSPKQKRALLKASKKAQTASAKRKRGKSQLIRKRRGLNKK